ncbi:hypothetical protein V6N13_046286 [Hibiscus sabdariffa]
MDAPRGRRGRRPARGSGRGHKADDPPVGDPLVQDPPVGGPPIGDPLVHVVVEPDDIDEVMVGRVVWRFLQRVGGSHLEAPRTTISKRLLAAGVGFFDGVSEAAPNLAELWLDHTGRV